MTKECTKRIGRYTVTGSDSHAQITEQRNKLPVVLEEFRSTHQTSEHDRSMCDPAFEQACKTAEKFRQFDLRQRGCPTPDQAQAMYRKLIQFGRQRFCKTATVTDGQCIGAALYELLDVSGSTDAAMEVLEQWNCHLSVALLDCVEKGNGTFSRNGRTFTATLPPYWDQMPS